MKYNITIPILVSKSNGTDIPSPVNISIKIDAKDRVSALRVFETRMLDLFEAEAVCE